MSFFYLKPVKGEMPLHLLETIVTKRLEHLTDIFNINVDSAVYNEFVVEGSVYDNVGYFTLCILSVLSESMNFKQFLIRAELELFKRRLESLSAYDLRHFAKKLLRYLNNDKIVPQLSEPLHILCQHLALKDIAQHVKSPFHNSDCGSHHFQIDFRYCLAFIAHRQVELKSGIAFVPCGKWKQFLISLFHMSLENRMTQTNIEGLNSDPRIIEILNKMREKIPVEAHDSINKHILKCRDVDKVTNKFPPCMLNLHRTLRTTHRLSHVQRFHYSLFLKDIGMPVAEAVDFWREEYIKAPNGMHNCCHNWEKDEKKYIYGIRHMYGLEGCRKNYTSVNCKRIQSLEGSCGEGGCPFKSFDENKMIELLKGCPDNVLGQIKELKIKQQYTSACLLFMHSKMSQNICDSSINFTPVKFYLHASNHVL